MKLKLTIYFALLCILLCSAAHAQVVTFPENGHRYEFVPFDGTALTWQEARDAAAMRQLDGQNGYLATLTSQAENDFVTNALDQTGIQDDSLTWIGGFKQNAAVDPEGDWFWETGPEAGTQFGEGANGTATPPFNYTNWALLTSEPNGAIAGENALAIDLTGVIELGGWADAPDDFVSFFSGYIVEYPRALPESQPVPVNSLVWLLALMTAMLMLGLIKARMN